jgi:hypothetical protein
MNQLVKKLFARIIRGAPAALALAALWTATAPLNAEAASFSAGNTIIRNTITVNYKDQNGNAQTAVTSTIDITVNTVAAAPTIVSVATSPGTTDGTGAQVPYAFVIRTNSNGPGLISFGAGDGTFNNVAAGTAPTVPGNIYLGSTIFDPSNFPPINSPGMLAQNIPVNGTITIAVPNDNGKANDSGVAHSLPDSTVINGLAVLDTVYITDGTTYYGPWQVTTVNDPVVGNGTTAAPGSIILKNIYTSALVFTPAYGWQIVEAKTVNVTVTQGAVTDPTAVASWVTTLTATMSGLSTSTPTATTNANMGKIDIKKYVRNVTTPVVGGGLTATSPLTGATNFYTTGVNGKPGEILEYLAVLTDTGRGKSTAVYATDLTPTYVTLIAGSAYGTSGGGTIFAQASYNATTATLKTDNSGGTVDVAYGKSTGLTAGSTMTFNLGTGCTNVYLTGGGTLTYNQAAYVIYQVKID